MCISRSAAKEAKAAKDEDELEGEGKKKKRAGGVQIPEDWPWEAAKQLFIKPDVLPADEVEASTLLPLCYSLPNL